MRRAILILALAGLSMALVSCADMPTAPRATVQVTGTILDRNGTGIQAAYVWFADKAPHSKGTHPAEFFAVTDLNGAFSASLPEGQYLIVISPPGFSAYAPTFLESQTIGRAGLRLDYRFNWVRVAVHPTISGGQTAKELAVQVYPDYSLGFIWSQDMRLAGTDREVFVPPGTYRMEMALTGTGYGYVYQYRTVQVTADTTMDVSFSGYAVTTHVTGPGGAPVQGGEIYASSDNGVAHARLDANGAAILYLPAGTYRFSAYAATSNVMGRVLPGVAVNGDASLNFDLSGTKWSGVVRRVSDGAPLGNMGVVAKTSDNHGAYYYTNSDGAFDLVVQPGRLYTFAVIDGQNGNVLYRAYSVPAGADSTFDITVDPNAPLQGASARDLMPAPPAGRDAPASAAADRGSQRRSSRTSG
ncbi:MAG: carboxypeptidase-like regulatory domain-containing protein [Bacteroidota bacterium]